MKQCPKCQALVHTGYGNCPACGHGFPSPQRARHTTTAGMHQVLAAEVTDQVFEVRDVRYSVHRRRGADAEDPPTLRVEYRLGLDHWISEFLGFEHRGYARQKAVEWWQRRSPDPVPESVERALELAGAGALALTDAVKVRSIAGEKYDRIVGYQLGNLPDAIGASSGPGEGAVVPF